MPFGTAHVCTKVLAADSKLHAAMQSQMRTTVLIRRFPMVVGGAQGHGVAETHALFSIARMRVHGFRKTRTSACNRVHARVR